MAEKNPMDACCRDHETKAAKAPAANGAKGEAGCCKACPTAGCDGCDCSKPENTSGCCMGGGCACANGR